MEDTFHWMTGYLVRGLEPQFYLGVSIVMGIPLCRRENPTKMDDLGVPPFQETSMAVPVIALHPKHHVI